MAARGRPLSHRPRADPTQSADLGAVWPCAEGGRRQRQGRDRLSRRDRPRPTLRRRASSTRARPETPGQNRRGPSGLSSGLDDRPVDDRRGPGAVRPRLDGRALVPTGGCWRPKPGGVGSASGHRRNRASGALRFPAQSQHHHPCRPRPKRRTMGTRGPALSQGARPQSPQPADLGAVWPCAEGVPATRPRPKTLIGGRFPTIAQAPTRTCNWVMP